MVSTLEVCVSALESKKLSNNSQIGGLESQPTSKNSEFDVAAARLESFKRLSRFVKDAASLIARASSK